MGRTLKEDLGRLPKSRRRKIEVRAAELIAEEMSLRALRKALNRTQVELAKIMGVGQHAVSRYEQRGDLMLSTLSRYVSALGGTLSILAEFPNKKPIRVRAFGGTPPRGRHTRRDPTARSRG